MVYNGVSLLWLVVRFSAAILEEQSLCCRCRKLPPLVVKEGLRLFIVAVAVYLAGKCNSPKISSIEITSIFLKKVSKPVNFVVLLAS
jgi:hypothetical protein